MNSQTNSLLPRTFDNEVVGSFFLGADGISRSCWRPCLRPFLWGCLVFSQLITQITCRWLILGGYEHDDVSFFCMACRRYYIWAVRSVKYGFFSQCQQKIFFFCSILVNNGSFCKYTTIFWNKKIFHEVNLIFFENNFVLIYVNCFHHYIVQGF